MPSKSDFLSAIENISRWGDTDVFPFAPENHILFDKSSEVADMLVEVHKDFDKKIQEDPPVNLTDLQLVTYEGFRWVSQLDPIWNAYLLGAVFSIHEEIESARISKAKDRVFSYRFKPDANRKSLFESDSWTQFIAQAEQLARTHSHVVVTDISDFYGRLYHHRIENSLLQLGGIEQGLPKKINRLLMEYSGSVSYGLPVGGPAARALSELALNRVDQLLEMRGIVFVRFADDYRLFADSQADAYRSLIELTELLHRHEGLTLQKQKTRVLRTADFLRTPLFIPEDSKDLTDAERDERELLRLSLRYDPYSNDAELEYERLKGALQKFDIIDMLTREVRKSRVNIPVVKRLTKSLGFLDADIKEAAVGTIMDSMEMLAPALPVVLRVLDDIGAQISDDGRAALNRELRRRIDGGAFFMDLPINRAYAMRVLRHENDEQNYYLAAKMFDSSPPYLQRDIVIHMHNWGNADWISEQRRQYANQHPWVKRSLVLSSFGLKDEGSHWRKKLALNAFDSIARGWMSERVGEGKMELPV
ncbi:RNA-directed DNA polymerase [Gordonia McavH-238-E]|uniref:RNA-directed DNA polymerase n=1 Tax=Gordonia sp. McavH-238-E TaxID=2917736 RepID=UPI001EF63061|nr:RNA-directed DNA polymerase [Gordonia sp. McavH-238-E]MCG7632624.1 RNA-directed DNA polymerase [Gordonia sp. McavH-238-E]